MSDPVLTDLHSAAGARLTPADAGSLLLTYGDVPGEYAAAREGALLLDLTTRGRLRVTGGDAEAFLHRLLANSVKGLEPGQGNRNLLLSAKGKVLHAMELEREADGFLLGCEPGRAADLLQALDMYLFTDDVQLSDESEACAPLALLGPKAAPLLTEVLSGDLPQDEGGHALLQLGGHGVRVSCRSRAGLPGYTLDAGPANAPALWRALLEAGARPGGLVALDCLRVEVGDALWGQDVDENVYPQEARWEPAFSLDKGCYIGQEVVAKIDTYGGLNKRLMALAVSDDDPVPSGTRLFREDDGEWRDLGVVTSWGYSFARDGGLALAYVKRKHQEPGTTFRLGDGPRTATLVELPVR